VYQLLIVYINTEAIDIHYEILKPLILLLSSSGKWSQLQIIFEAVDTTDPALRIKYPMGVKVSHRAFVQDTVKLLRK
jgi:hypothetical protein